MPKDNEPWDEKTVAEINELLDANTAKLRQLNDALRMYHQGGIVVITPGISGLGPTFMSRILTAVAEFKDFTEDNDPHGEHDCAVMTVEDIRIIWKIDYYDKRRRYASSDPTDPSVTSRVLTVMRADEY
ncbi:DUF3768 domain-containing protein [Mesorhizobium sp. CN2-181]|uniref:DUF3768 domain-containing protein n=1 Tax=Mesorhizobium yinganensis TaxID=3157707 RepID=UPI0032B852D6